MTLFLTLLPIYLFGNIHCAGMCGPLMMLLAKNRYRWAYFGDRLTSYTFAGLLSAEAGMFFFQILARSYLSAFLSIAFGLTIIALAFFSFFRLPYPGSKWVAKRTAGLSTFLARLITVYGPIPIFLFGVCTLLLPCGQTLVVFSACALEAKPLSGLINGSLFALLTSPSLILSMSAFKRVRDSYHIWVGCATLLVGLLSLFRGLADLDLIAHLILNPNASPRYHIVLF
ncbi:MAG: sulfite exporter TauE/SafE family protein [Chlamydiales bacterium]|nr:sulfite exporter TauE/SafE family protein [Chlamydiales bacterium]